MKSSFAACFLLQPEFQAFKLQTGYQCCVLCHLSLLGHLLHHYPDISILNGPESPNSVRALSAVFFDRMRVSLKLLFRLPATIWYLKWTARGAPSWAWLSRCDLPWSWLQQCKWFWCRGQQQRPGRATPLHFFTLSRQWGALLLFFKRL